MSEIDQNTSYSYKIIRLGKFSGFLKWQNPISGSNKPEIFIYKVPFTFHSLVELIHNSTNAKKNRTIQCLQKIASKLVSSLPTASYRIWLLRQLFCQVQLFPANYSSKFKDRLSSEKKTSCNQVHLETVFANLLSPSFMCIMLVMPE